MQLIGSGESADCRETAQVCRATDRRHAYEPSECGRDACRPHHGALDASQSQSRWLIYLTSCATNDVALGKLADDGAFYSDA